MAAFTAFSENDIHEGSVFSALFGSLSTQHQDKTALIDGFTNKSVTYHELKHLSLRLAEGLRRYCNKTSNPSPLNSSAQAKPNPTVLVYCQNSIEYLVVLFACQALGIPWSSANPAYTPSELAYQLKDTSASLIFASSEGKALENAFEAIALSGHHGYEVWAMPDIKGNLKTNVEGLGEVRGWNELLVEAGEANKESWVVLTKEQAARTIAMLPYSSGTTGKPKGVELTHRNINAMLQQLAVIPDLYRSDDIRVNPLPLFHIAGLMAAALSFFYKRATVVIIPRFDLDLYCSSAQKYRATILSSVPPLAMSQAPSVLNYDLSSMRYLSSGAAPMSGGIETELSNRFTQMKQKKLRGTLEDMKVHVIQLYGMTETSLCITAMPPRAPRTGAGSCGQLVPGVQARLVRDDGKDVDPPDENNTTSQPGEVWVRGPNIMKNYHNNPDATRATITPDEWFRTGDVAVIDRDGYFWIVDRLKELIKYSGFQVAPAELEALLLTCPLVVDAGVIGVWSEKRKTELPQAYVVLTPQGKSNPNISQSITSFVDGRVAPYKRLRGGIIPVDSIPRSASGKILRKQLRDAFVAETKETAKL